MLSRFTRIFVLAVIIVTVPSVFFFYSSGPPEFLGSNSNPNGQAYAVDAGGIDSPHWREPVKPNAEGGFGQHVVPEQAQAQAHAHAVEIEDEEARDATPLKENAWVADQDEPGAEQIVSGGERPSEEGVDADGNVGSGGVAPEQKEGGDKAVSSGGEEEGGDWLNAVADVNGATIMPKMGNETAKAELGRGTWRLLHLVTMRYPDKPTDDERATLKTFFYMFAKLYPCGDCAKHFQQMLKEYPPQTASRQNASLWLCSLHNKVNARLGKPEFDCSKLDETFDCGCGNETATATEMSETATAANVG